MARSPIAWRAAAAAVACLAAAGNAAVPGRLCATVTDTCLPPPYVAVVSAFPAETAPLLAGATVTELVDLDQRRFHLGTLAGVRVVVVRGGIGLVNAAATARALIDRFDLSAIVFSGVAGSGLDVGDVAVPGTWTDGSEVVPVDAQLLDVAATIAAAPPPLAGCTPVPPDPPGATVCLGRTPRVVVGGAGESTDPFAGAAAGCTPGAGPVFGCDEALAAVPRAADASDMESVAVARVARDAGVPFLAVRGVSDGGGDPLGLPGFPAQFFAYYDLAARNAAAVTAAILSAWSAQQPPPLRHARKHVPGGRPGGSLSAACDWERAAAAACVSGRAPAAVTRLIAAACALSTQDDAAAIRRTRARLAAAARRLERGDAALAPACRHALFTTLREEARGR